MRSLSTVVALLAWLAVLGRLGALAEEEDDDIDFEEDEDDPPVPPEPPKAAAKPKPEVEGPVIGIDLGTTFSCVAVMKASGVEIIPNDQGNRITPSYVSYSKGGRLIGEAAKNEATENPTNTLFDIKRLIGRRFGEKTVQDDMKTLPYNIVEEEDKLMVQAEVSGNTKTMPPELVSSMVLTKMKETAEAFLGDKVENAVITVPAYFTNSQREATRDAGKLAGLNVLRIINEPTAAALAYGLDKKDETSILVYDLGGGTFDVSLLSVAEGVIEVVATNGDTHLGGEDFDRRLAEYLQEVFEERSGKKIGDDKRALHKLRQAAERAKIALSRDTEWKVDIESLAGGVDFQETVNRAKFEELNNELFKKTLLPVKQVLEDGKTKKSDVDEIVLVGGSTRIPKVQSLLKDFFNGKEPNTGLNPDEAVAFGAAVQGGILSGTAAENTVLLDITPISIGIETNGGIMDKMIPRNTAIPVSKTKSYVTSSPDVTSTDIKVFEGERPLVKHNNLLGSFVLSGFPKAPAGLGHTITLDIDVNGIMKVSAKITKSGLENKMTITKDSSRLTQEQIDEMIKSEEESREADEKAVEHQKAWTSIKDFKTIANWKVGKIGDELAEEDKNIIDECKASLDALTEDSSTEEMENKKSQCETDTKPIFDKFTEKIFKQSKEDGDDAADDAADEDDDDPEFDADDEEVAVDEAPAPAERQQEEL